MNQHHVRRNFDKMNDEILLFSGVQYFVRHFPIYRVTAIFDAMPETGLNLGDMGIYLAQFSALAMMNRVPGDFFRCRVVIDQNKIVPFFLPDISRNRNTLELCCQPGFALFSRYFRLFSCRDISEYDSSPPDLA